MLLTHYIPDVGPFMLTARDDLVVAKLVQTRRGPFRQYAGDWYRRGSDLRWRRIDSSELIEAVYGVLSEGSVRKKRGLEPLDRSAAALRSVLGLLAETREERAPDLNPETLPLADCLLEVTSRQVRPFDGAFSPFYLPVTRAELEQASTPTCWLDFLASGFKHSADVSILQEFTGYMLFPDQPLQRALWIYGLPASGKGTIVRVLTALIGEPHVWSGDATALTGRFKGETFPRARLITLPDYRASRDATRGLAFLLNVIGGDSVLVERKYLDPISVRPPGKVLFASNELPKFQDGTGAALRRLLIIQRNGSWAGVRQDAGLQARLMAELPGILLWALEGYHRLRTRGDFDLSTQNPRLLYNAARATNHTLGFVHDCLELEALDLPDCPETSMQALLDSYKAWCARTNTPCRLTIEDLAVNLKSTLQSQIRAVEHPFKGYRGIRVKKEA